MSSSKRALTDTAHVCAYIYKKNGIYCALKNDREELFQEE